ncbi:alkaline phosphatase D family protein [Microlunatus speluncae]|uniref:alkaline phosphatase D family protein n=1 Tax=Microlunatus speluncae TaxID=2594267 RepID=UPI001C2D24AD|nr:alkaline phosphatase D family protein [Microlunatus speluncae]
MALPRRSFLGLAAGTAAATSALTFDSAAAAPLPKLSDPFTLGVASGDPLPNAVVLWTRLAPDPLKGGGMPARTYRVEWEVAADDKFSRVVRSGVASASPSQGHSVHVDAVGLEPGRTYWFRFRQGEHVSPVGRTRTAPSVQANPESLRWGVTSCQNWEAGYYNAHRHLAEEDLDFVAFLGDYIYEGKGNPNALRTHEGTDEPYSLTDYRNRHAQYRTDADLQAAHAAHPFICTPDDHEIDNNWADDIPQDPQNQTPEAFRKRRIAALQAYYEHMPFRRTQRPHGPDMQIYRAFRFGRLLDVPVLDTRQYRSDQISTLAEAEAPGRTITGEKQEKWLLRRLTDSPSRWNVLANQVMWAQNDRTAGPAESFDFDNMDGYRWQRRRVLEQFRQVSNPVIMTGDRHCTWACDLKTDFDHEGSEVVGAEFTGTSITSGGDADPVAFHKSYDPIMADSPHWRYIDNQRGYLIMEANRKQLTTQLRLVDTVTKRESKVRTEATFVVLDGVPGITEVDAAKA